jgi:hypothetical protein
VRAQDAGLDEAARTKRRRLETWLDEQLRAQSAGGRSRQRDDFLREAEQQAAYRDFRDLARGVVRDDPSEGFGFLLQLVCEELSEELPGFLVQPASAI